MSIDLEEPGVPEDVDVSTSARLAAALEAVRREPGGWESALGAAVDAAVVAAVPDRVGPGRIAYLVDRGFWSGRAEVVAELVGVVRELVMMRPVLLEVGPDRLWPAVVSRAVWQLSEQAEGDRQHGLAGDSQPFRLRDRADRAGISFLQVDASDLAPSEVAGARAVESVDLDRSGWRVATEDVAGPLLGCLVSILADFGIPRGVALAGTRRVLEIAVGPGKRRERHSMARGDAGEGVLASLGVSPAAAGAWMSLVAGSRREGLESALLWTLHELSVSGMSVECLAWDEVLSASQLRWLRTVASGVVVQAPVAPAPARRAPSHRMIGNGEQLALFPVEGVSAGAAA